MSVAHTLAIGIGNRWRRDDGVGTLIAERLAARARPGLAIAQSGGDGAALVEAFAGAPRVWLFDAVHAGAAPGTLHRLDAAAGALPQGLFGYSSHAFGVAEAIELARALGRLPAQCVLYGVEGADFGNGEGLSPAVAAAAEKLVGEIESLLEAEAAPCTKRA